MEISAAKERKDRKNKKKCRGLRLRIRKKILSRETRRTSGKSPVKNYYTKPVMGQPTL